MRRLWNACKYSASGLAACWSSEAAFRQEVALTCVLVPAALLVPVPALLRLVLLLANVVVLVTELLNSAVETVVDHVCPEIHPLAKRAKDMGSAAVLLSLVGLALAWLFAVQALVTGP
jgi:diacylglycerol kinase (ATP)